MFTRKAEELVKRNKVKSGTGKSEKCNNPPGGGPSSGCLFISLSPGAGSGEGGGRALIGFRAGAPRSAPANDSESYPSLGKI